MMSLELLLPAAFMILNMIRGGASKWISAIPGPTKVYVAVAIGLICWPLMSPWQAAGFGVGFLCAMSLGWGRWFDFGRFPVDPNRKSSWFELAIERVTPAWDWLRFLIRNLVCYLPLAYLVDWRLLALAPLQVGFYWIAWYLSPRDHITTAEALTGIAWGLAALLVHQGILG